MSMSINEALILWDKSNFSGTNTKFVGDFETFCRAAIDDKTPSDPSDPSDDQEKTPNDNSNSVSINYISLISLLSSTYDSKLLKEKYCSILEILINEHNLSILWNHIIALNYAELNFICLNFFCKNVPIIRSNSSIMKEMSLDIIKYIITVDHIEMKEIDIFEFVHDWIKINNPQKKDIDEIMYNIRFPLMSGKELIDIVRPTGVFDDASYIEALEHVINPQINVSQKFTPRNDEYIRFYLAPYYSKNEYLKLGFRIITSDDITEKFNAAIKKYVDKNSGIAALVNFSTSDKSILNLYGKRWIRTNDVLLKCGIGDMYLGISNTSYIKHSIYPIYSGSYKIESIPSIILGSNIFTTGFGETDGIAIYVRTCTRF